MPLTKVRGSGVDASTVLKGQEVVLDSDGDTSLTADTDDQIDIRIAGTDVGTFTQASGKFTVNSTGSNLSLAVGGTVQLNTDTTQFYPGTDNSHNLGISSLRFKDLYLSGGVYAGGTGSANYLDHYEEGTWTPAFVGATNSPGLHNNVGRYTRIGRLVVLQFFQQTSGSPAPTFSNNSAAFQISGVPFSVQGHGYTGSQGSMNAQAFHYTGSNNTQSTTADFCSPNVNGNDLLEFQVTRSGSTRGVMNNNGAKAAPYVVEVTISYFTDA